MLEDAQDIRAVGGDGHGMLELHRQAAVGGDDRPAIGQQNPVVLAGVDHRLDGEGQAGAQARAAFGLANVGDGQLFVQHAADAVAAPLVDDADPLSVGVVLDGPADVEMCIRDSERAIR